MRVFATQVFLKALRKLAKKKNHYRSLRSDFGSFLHACA